MAQKRKIGQQRISKREQERREIKKTAEKSNFSTIVMRVFIIVLLAAMLIGMAIQIIVYN